MIRDLLNSGDALDVHPQYGASGQSPGARESSVPNVATHPVVPERSPPDVTAAVVAITDQARSEIRRVATVLLMSIVVVGAALAWQLERIRDAILNR